MHKILSVAFICSIFFCTSSFAVNQYRCNGRVQYQPCLDSNDSTTTANATLQNAQRKLFRSNIQLKRKITKDPGLYAEVVSSNFRRRESIDGQWRGRVRGNGDIHMTLQILRANTVESTRYMGHVALTNGETSFNFISAAPKGTDWTWRILALAKTKR